MQNIVYFVFLKTFMYCLNLNYVSQHSQNENLKLNISLMNCPFAIHPFVSNMINKEAKLGISEGTWLQYQLTFI